MAFFTLTHETSFTPCLTLCSPCEVYWIIIKHMQESERTFSWRSLLSIWGVKTPVLEHHRPGHPAYRAQTGAQGWGSRALAWTLLGAQFLGSLWDPCNRGCVTVLARERRSKSFCLWCRCLSPGRRCWEPWTCLPCVAAISPGMELCCMHASCTSTHLKLNTIVQTRTQSHHCFIKMSFKAMNFEGQIRARHCPCSIKPGIGCQALFGYQEVAKWVMLKPWSDSRTGLPWWVGSTCQQSSFHLAQCSLLNFIPGVRLVLSIRCQSKTDKISSSLMEELKGNLAQGPEWCSHLGARLWSRVARWAGLPGDLLCGRWWWELTVLPCNPTLIGLCLFPHSVTTKTTTGRSREPRERRRAPHDWPPLAAVPCLPTTATWPSTGMCAPTKAERARGVSGSDWESHATPEEGQGFEGLLCSGSPGLLPLI